MILDLLTPPQAGLEISQNRHLPCITKIIGIYGKKFNCHYIEISKFSLALQPEALVNTSGRVQFSSPAREQGHFLLLHAQCMLVTHTPNLVEFFPMVYDKIA